MHVVFPASPLRRREPDDLVADQCAAFAKEGHKFSFLSIEALQSGIFDIHSGSAIDEEVIYRGWMLTAEEYKLLHDGVVKKGGRMLVSPDQYLMAHYLPRWYELISEFTAETIILSAQDATADRVASIGWSGYFIKDYVKSLKTSLGSKIHDPNLLPAVLKEMQHFRGRIEGGICLRRLEELDTKSERRYFIIRGRAYASAPREDIPTIVAEAAKRIRSPFFSVDVAMRSDGVLRIVEIGDGQVSDLVGWTAERFVGLWNKTSGSHAI